MTRPKRSSLIRIQTEAHSCRPPTLKGPLACFSPLGIIIGLKGTPMDRRTMPPHFPLHWARSNLVIVTERPGYMSGGETKMANRAASAAASASTQPRHAAQMSLEQKPEEQKQEEKQPESAMHSQLRRLPIAFQSEASDPCPCARALPSGSYE